MARQYPSSIRHRRAFEAWYAAGRKINKAVLVAAKRDDRHTVYSWRDAEGWAQFADQLDAQATEAVAAANDTAVRQELTRREQFLEQRENILKAAGKAVAAMLARMLERLSVGADVDYMELDQFMAAFARWEKVGVSTYDLANPMKVALSGGITVSESSVERVRTALLPILDKLGEYGIDINEADIPLATA